MDARKDGAHKLADVSQTISAAAWRPQSAVSQIQPLLGLLAVACSTLIVVRAGLSAPVGALLIISAASAAMIIYEAAVQFKAISLACWKRPCFTRLLVKQIGLTATYAAILSCYWLFPIYQFSQRSAVSVIMVIGVAAFIVSPVYIWVTDGFMDTPEDGLYSFGLAVLGKWAECDLNCLKDYCRAWAIKAFFLPLMLWYVLGSTGLAKNFMLMGSFTDPHYLLHVFSSLGPLLDVTFAAVGYMCTFRLLDTHIRSTDDTWWGWLACLICYVPFSNVLSNFTGYEAASSDGWFEGTIIGPLWAIALVAGWIFYLWTTLSFGLRFSNLTNRGIITNGPYRWTKHPSYIVKNVNWMMLWAPFVSHYSATGILRVSLCWALGACIYFARAKSEELHLSSDPVYVAYAHFVKEHGAIAVVRRRLSWGAALLAWRL